MRSAGGDSLILSSSEYSLSFVFLPFSLRISFVKWGTWGPIMSWSSSGRLVTPVAWDGWGNNWGRVFVCGTARARVYTILETVRVASLRGRFRFNVVILL